MKTALLAVPTLAVGLLLAACEPESKPPRTNVPPPGQTGADPTPSPSPDPGPTPTPTPDPSSTPPAATPSPTPAATVNIPYGVPVPGKPGFVTSPYLPGSGYVDVRGFPPNSEVKDPYSGKTFLVP